MTSTTVLDRPINSTPQVISADEAAALVGISSRTIRRLCADGKIPNCAQLGRQWRINRTTFLQLFGIAE